MLMPSSMAITLLITAAVFMVYQKIKVCNVPGPPVLPGGSDQA